MSDSSEIGKGLFRWTAGRFEQAVPPDWYVRAVTEAKGADWEAFRCTPVTSYGEPDLIHIEVSDTLDGERYVLVMDACAEIWEALVAKSEWPHFFRDELLPLIAAANRMESTYHMDRLSTVAIAIGRHGLGTDLDESTGRSRADLRLEWKRTQEARERRA
jgi:hypothetical protein